MEQLKLLAEGIRLPVDAALWSQVSNNESAKLFLEQDKPRIALIGTDENLTLAKEILADHPQAIITILEKNPVVAEAAEKQIPSGVDVEIIQQDIKEDLVPYKHNLKTHDLVVAKHLIHFVNAPELISQVRDKLLNPHCLFFASAPPLLRLRTSLELRGAADQLRKMGIKYSQKPLQSYWKGTLFTFWQLGQK